MKYINVCIIHKGGRYYKINCEVETAINIEMRSERKTYYTITETQQRQYQYQQQQRDQYVNQHQNFTNHIQPRSQGGSQSINLSPNYHQYNHHQQQYQNVTSHHSSKESVRVNNPFDESHATSYRPSSNTCNRSLTSASCPERPSLTG